MGVWLTKTRATNWLGLLIALPIVFTMLFVWVYYHDASAEGGLFTAIVSALSIVLGYFMKGDCATCAARAEG